MAATDTRPPIQPGEAAPDFALPAVGREGTVSLTDYRGKSPVLVALLRGLYCPLCRRHIAQMGVTRDRLQELGVETLGIVATRLENARFYFKFRPARIPLAADPELATHRLYRLPRPVPTPEMMQAMQSVRINPTGELSEPLPIIEAAAALDRLHKFDPTPTDHVEAERQFPQLVGQFLIDRGGIVRWANIECAKDGLAGLGIAPTDTEILTAAQALRN